MVSGNVEVAAMRTCVLLVLCASTVSAVLLRGRPSQLQQNNSVRTGKGLDFWTFEGLEDIGAAAGVGALNATGTATRGSCFKDGFVESRPTTKLEFVHIPRNAGTSVEMCSLTDPSRPAEQKWGVANPNIQGMYAMPKPDKGYNWTVPWPPKCYKQHVPPQYIPDVYEGKETFCVVRDPYARMVSQFKFLSIHSKTITECSAAEMNKALLDHLKKAKEENPYFGDCHYLPQAVFVFGMDPSTAKTWYRTRGCKNVLHLETLTPDFGALMAQHGYPYELLKDNRAGGTVGSKDCSGLNKHQLSPENRRLIEDIYADDFKHFNYPLMA